MFIRCQFSRSELFIAICDGKSKRNKCVCTTRSRDLCYEHSTQSSLGENAAHFEQGMDEESEREKEEEEAHFLK